MTNLASILKSRDITLPTKVHLVKAMVFPVVIHVWMWELDHKEAWVQQKWCFWTVVLEKTLESPLDSKEMKSINPIGNQPWIFIGRTDAKAEAPILWPPGVKSWFTGKDPDAGKDWRQKKKMAETKMVTSTTDSIGMNLSKYQDIVEDREAWSAAVHGVAKSRTWLSDWTELNPDSKLGFLLLSSWGYANVLVMSCK